jgi:hypothetical protein
MSSAVKSKPVYSALRADVAGSFHLLVGQAEGEVALRRVVQELGHEAPALLLQTHVLFERAPHGPHAQPSIEAPSVRLFDDTALLLDTARDLLEHARMGLRLYVAGAESFIGRVLQVALAFNLNKDEIRAEELGSKARRVHCIHCRVVSEDVSTNITRCVGCHRWLMVRDHYSRRLAAYMGVMVDAEAPGERPPLREIYT